MDELNWNLKIAGTGSGRRSLSVLKLQTTDSIYRGESSNQLPLNVIIAECRWLGSVVVSALDSQLDGRGSIPSHHCAAG